MASDDVEVFFKIETSSGWEVDAVIRAVVPSTSCPMTTSCAFSPEIEESAAGAAR